MKELLTKPDFCCKSNNRVTFHNQIRLSHQQLKNEEQTNLNDTKTKTQVKT